MRRRRYQKGSLQLRKHGDRRVWTVLYYKPDGRRGYHTLGFVSDMTKSEAQDARDAFMREKVNGDRTTEATRPPTVSEFLNQRYFDFYRGKWKLSTRATTEQRMLQHIEGDLGQCRFEDLTLAKLQDFLQSKADAGCSGSIVKHLRFDLKSVFRLALAEGIVDKDPTPALYTPPNLKPKNDARMNIDQVRAALEAVPERERVILHLGCLAGMRPGEIVALQRTHVSADCLSIDIKQRVYEGVIDSPKTNPSSRTVKPGPETAALLATWIRNSVGNNPDAYVFASEAGTPLRPGNLMRRIIRPALEKLGLRWVNFQVMRRTQASLSHEAGIDPKVSADQRGHTIGVSLDVYTRIGDKKKARAARTLERIVLQWPEKKQA